MKTESKFCLIHIRELFLMKKWGKIEMKIESKFDPRWSCLRALHFTLLRGLGRDRGEKNVSRDDHSQNI